MLQYVIRRLLHMIPIVIGVAALVFTLFTTVGEDPALVALGQHATAEALADLRAEWGLDKPTLMQFVDFLGQIATFDYGRSFNTNEKLSDIFRAGAVVSLSLTVLPYFFGALTNIAIAMLIAFYRGSLFDRVSTIVFVAGMSISYLVYIIAFQYLLAFQFDWFPISGYATGVDSVQYLLLPWIIILVVAAGPEIRVYRTVFLDETKADYVRTAFAKGLGSGRVLFKHILKNAMIPILTNMVIGIPFLILGAFLLERFFSIPGLGDILINAINTGDFPIIKGLSVLIAIAYSFFNLLTDVLYAFVDPRVQLS
ncbi:MAG: ABC transporter permease [Myxococcota bacterium]